MLPFIFIVLQGISKVRYLCSFISISKLNHWPIRFQTVTNINELQTLVSLFFVNWIHSTIKATDWLLYISSFSTLAFKLLLHVNQFFYEATDIYNMSREVKKINDKNRLMYLSLYKKEDFLSLVLFHFTETDILQSIACLITLIQVSLMQQRKTILLFANDQFSSSLKLKQVKVLHMTSHYA